MRFVLMGRPQLESDKKLSKRFIFRLSEAELQALIAAAEICGKTAGALVREKLFKGKFPKAASPKLDVTHYAELKRIGVNLNQLSRLCHTGRMPKELLGLLSRLEQRLETTIAKLIYDSHSEDR
ncbi:plasmid mobilization protein [Mucilaginibacter conchicola]|nr:plasmid mobilization relaxosome protein MobC [Mucilaginibacter conchicola]